VVDWAQTPAFYLSFHDLYAASRADASTIVQAIFDPAF
jgi:hypothetical protein